MLNGCEQKTIMKMVIIEKKVIEKLKMFNKLQTSTKNDTM